ncbi:VOC family protein [Stappia indica]|uniref:Catechol 2,3-dioxygenase n=1 Tax=Stappia indica TaxID=538381 RepID=A0A285TDR9_9HYPH|nr:VOC family protein [Stappia indica]MCC4246776.1 VOC family protein [Stappia indica]SOC20223.1 Catechol 2,3-dioxygenase [Stappia indica]
MSVTQNHTGITVADLDRSEAMFRDLFGFETISRAPRDPGTISRVIGVDGCEVEIAYMRNGTATVELLCYSAPQERGDFRPRPCDLGSLHLGFDVDDMDEMLKRCAEWSLDLLGDVVVVSAGPNKGKRIAYLRNPGDGVVLELIER